MQTSSKNWKDWEWQQRNSISSTHEIQKQFPSITEQIIDDINEYGENLRFKLTPYIFSLIKKDVFGNPKIDDPLLNQFLPISNGTILNDVGCLEENWELPEDTVTPILQHKHKNRVAFRIQNTCLSYCMYCFEARRVLDKDSSKQSFTNTIFEDSINYIKSHPEIDEVIISGGEPLVLSNQKLNLILQKVDEITHVKSIRIHTRALTHNPFRIDDELIEIISKYKVNCINLHIAHPNEITDEFKYSLNLLKEAKLLILSHTPLLKGINDDVDTLKDLFIELFSLGVKPYYLLHAMPETVLSDKFRTSVLKGVEIMKSLKRFYSNPAIPEYIIVHKDGKQTVPLELDSTSEFKYEDGNIKFKNWKGDWSVYPEISG